VRTDLTAFARRVRVRAGSASVSDVNDETLQEAVTSALSEYGKYRGPQTVKVISTEVDKQDYQIPEPLVIVDEVIWGDDVDVRGDIFLRTEAFSPFDALAGLDTFKNPSLLNIVYTQMEDFRSQFEGRWELYDSPTGNQLWMRISPPPWTAQKMALIGKAAATIESVPDKDAEILIAAALWKLNEMRHEGVAGVESYSFGGGSVTFGTKNFMELAEKHEQNFRDLVGASLPRIFTG
jgi:hypothetical protein